MVVAKLVILGILFLTSFILALRVVLVTKLVASVVLSSIFLILALYTSFSMTSFFTTSLTLFKSKDTGTNLSTFILCTLLFGSGKYSLLYIISFLSIHLLKELS